MTRNSYETALKHLVRLDCTQAIPGNILTSLPRSCIYRWKNEKSDKYTGNELNQIAREKMELLRDFSRNHKAQRVFLAYGKVMLTFSKIAKSFQNFSSHLRTQKEKVVNTVLQAAKTITVDNAIKVFGISRSAFQSWLAQVKFKCKNSPKGMLRTCLAFVEKSTLTNCDPEK